MNEVSLIGATCGGIAIGFLASTTLRKFLKNGRYPDNMETLVRKHEVLIKIVRSDISKIFSLIDEIKEQITQIRIAIGNERRNS